MSTRSNDITFPITDNQNFLLIGIYIQNFKAGRNLTDSPT